MVYGSLGEGYVWQATVKVYYYTYSSSADEGCHNRNTLNNFSAATLPCLQADTPTHT